jgi:NAD(P)-dependent dehydrogenase (short-subunit alcohol dehydrogenase family)
MSTAEAKVAFVTGASRGIGKVIAVELARAGYDVAITARTVNEGEEREHSSTLKKSNTKPLPGSLSTTGSAIESLGRRALMLPADLLDFDSLRAAASRTLEEWGRVDVLVNNGRYIGPGHMDLFLDTPIEILDAHLKANVLAPLVLAQAVIPRMAELGGGDIVNITSASGYADPTKPAGQGGWGMGYGISKGAFHRVAGFLSCELAGQNIRSFNVQPGLVATERIGADMAEFGIENVGAPAEVVAATVVWLLTNPEGDRYNGRNVEAQFFCHERGLVPGWPGPDPNAAPIRYDRSGAELDELERALRDRLEQDGGRP